MDSVELEMKKLPAGVGAAILAAVLFGASTPFAKLLLGKMPPVLLAGLLYLGSGIGLTLLMFGTLATAASSRSSPFCQVSRLTTPNSGPGLSSSPKVSLSARRLTSRSWRVEEL